MVDRRALIRAPGTGHVAADFVELFFDLVYVFAVTQLSHFLLAHMGWVGLIEVAILFLAIWWAWTYTVWATNWLEPQRVPVRILIFAIMLASLVMSASIPDAFGERGLGFALAYVAIQLFRTLWVAWVMWRDQPALGRTLLRIAIWFAATAPLWIVGALSDPSTRLWLWGLAIGIEFLGPAAQFVVPGFGRSRTSDYAISGTHMAERCALFIIVALGEGILVTSATFAELAWTPATVGAALIAFLGSVAIWWVYFDVGMRRGSERIDHVEDSGRIARNAYTYGHIPVVAGIVVAAVADEILMTHPLGHSSPGFLLAMIGGSALFLFGAMLFKRMTGGRRFWPLSHLAGLALFAAEAAWAFALHPVPLAVGTVTVAILVVVAVWEWGSFHGGWVERGWPVPPILRRYVAWRRDPDDHDKAVPPAKDRS